MGYSLRFCYRSRLRLSERGEADSPVQRPTPCRHPCPPSQTPAPISGPRIPTSVRLRLACDAQLEDGCQREQARDQCDCTPRVTPRPPPGHMSAATIPRTSIQSCGIQTRLHFQTTIRWHKRVGSCIFFNRLTYEVGAGHDLGDLLLALLRRLAPHRGQAAGAQAAGNVHADVQFVRHQGLGLRLRVRVDGPAQRGCAH